MFSDRTLVNVVERLLPNHVPVVTEMIKEDKDLMIHVEKILRRTYGNKPYPNKAEMLSALIKCVGTNTYPKYVGKHASVAPTVS